MRKKLISLFTVFAMMVTMIPMAGMTAFALEYTYELPAGMQIYDTDGNPVESSAEMGEQAPWRVLDNNVYIRSEGLVIKGSLNTEVELYLSKSKHVILEDLSGPINASSYQNDSGSLTITLRGENHLKRIIGRAGFIIINGSGVLDIESINSFYSPLVIDGVKININNGEDGRWVYALSGEAIYVTNATVEVNVEKGGMPVTNGSIILSEYLIKGKKNINDTSWEPATMKVVDNQTIFCIGDDECKCYKLIPKLIRNKNPMPEEENAEDESKALAELKAATTKPAGIFCKVKAGKKKIKVTWAEVEGAAGYQIYCKQRGKSAKKIAVKAGTKSKTIKKLKKGKKYTVKIRAYKKYDGNKLYGPWSKARTVRLK